MVERTYAAELARSDFVESLFLESSIGLNLCRMDGHWLRSNPAFLRIIGYDEAEASAGKLTYWQLTPRKYDADEANQLASLGQTGRYGPYEKEFIRKDGSLVPVRLNGFIVNVGGEKMIWSFIEDITAERALESSRVQAIQAAKLSALGEMAAATAHEINNPLTIISNYGFVLRDAIARGDQALCDEALHEIQRAVERAAEITRGLRRVSRSSVAVEVLEVKDVINDAAALTGARTRAEGLSLTLEVSTAARVRGSAVQLGQVLINLVNNAVDAVRDAPVREVALRARDVGPAVDLLVEDSGRGVAPEHVGRIFDPFFTTKPANEGTGLGLSISRKIVTELGGELTFERVGDRTVFRVRLPQAGVPT